MTISANFQQAARYEAAGQLDEAAHIYQSILKTQPRSALAWHALGVLSFKLSNPQQAFEMFANAVRLEPNNALFHRNLCEISRRLGKFEQAQLCGEAACKLAPKDVDAHYNLGLVYTDLGEYTKAVQAYKRATKVNPKHGLSWNNLGSALEQLGDKKAALKAYEKAVAINAQHAEAQNNAGVIYSEQGSLDQARQSFEAAITIRPSFVESHYNLSALKTYTVSDPHLAMLESVYGQREQLTPNARIRYGFALGKALDDIGQYDRAFAAYDEGNRIQHSMLPVDETRDDKLVDDIIQTFTHEFFAERQHVTGSTVQGKTPIFIVGMPRSGTTLLEQILCTHPSVYGAGELVELNEAISNSTNLQSNQGSNFASNVVSLSPEQIKKIGDDYLQSVWKLSPHSRYITDKMPGNFFYLGLIHLALPHAKIIHAMRDPIDSCFSCFSRLFNDTMEFAYDQGTIGRYYRRYITLMRHWHQVLPAGRILDLSYEEMVVDTEGQARRVLNFVGLPWNEQCLQFYKNDRVVKTASVAQVRKPIYKTSVARWKHFARHLQPLLALVREYRDVNDEPDVSLLPVMPKLHSDVPAELANQCISLQGQGDHVGVINLLALHLPNFGIDTTAAVLWHLQGISFYRLDRFEEARISYERSLEIQPNHPTCLNSLGFLLQDMGLMKEALVAFESAIEQSPDMAMARLNLGMAQLKLGDFANGLENYESRWNGSAESVQGSLLRPVCPLPNWEGLGTNVDTKDKGLLVITEQGFGDTFQYSRYLNLVTPHFKKVGFVCSEPTRRLMEWAFNEEVVLLTQMPREFETWHYQCTLMSLPRACQTRLETIPSKVPYLKVPTAASQHWKDRLHVAAPGRYRIGIAWAGRKVHQYDARRSLSFTHITPLLNTPHITWVSLQKWAPEEARPNIPDHIDWIDWTEELNDFGDTAALIENLDLIISIDSSMVHLAGALNKPVWMMNRFDCEWRWLESRVDSPWYSSLRIFNQPTFGDWQSVLNDVANALKKIDVPKGEAKTRSRVQPATPATTPASAQGIEQIKLSAQPVVPAQVVASSPANQPNQPNQLGQSGDQLSPEQAIQIASQYQASGRLQEAEQLLRQILKFQPKNAHALHLLGVVTFQAGQPILAFDLIRQAIEIEPAALFESNLAEMLRQQGRVDEAIEHGRKAVSLDPTMASAHSNLGIALFDAMHFEEAEKAHQRGLALAPNLLQSLNNLGSIERARGNKSQALVWYRKALAISPDFIESLTNIGAVLVEEDRPEEAVQPLLKVLQAYPDSPEALCNLGLSYFKQDDMTKGEALLRRSLENRPGYPEAQIGLARLLQDDNRIDEAKTLLLDLTNRLPDKTDAWCQLGSVLTEQGDAEQAQAAFKRALSVDSKAVDAITGLANLNLEAGKIDDAVAGLQAAIEIDPDNIGARFHLTQSAKVKKGCANLAVLEAKATSLHTLSADKRISLHYALGKAYDDLKAYDKAFPHFIQGAKLKRQKIQYSALADANRTRNIIETFSPDFFKSLSGGGDLDATPIFVLGMPRSGTTLTEQIIASHPLVHGAGELNDLFEVVQQPVKGSAVLPYPDNLRGIHPNTLTQWGAAYIARLRQHSSTSQRITDKMPVNYMAMGLIVQMLPNAKIVHVKRNPVDTCLSCFTRLFNRHQDATYDLAELGQHYVSYDLLMHHWRRLLPPDSFIEVQYEDIVADMVGQSKRLIEFVGLPWHDACLDFHKNERSIRTASVAQVRQPIYNSSVERWRHYETFLTPLLDELKVLA
jgi:tetratricopeptide (TPR) repeat protein